MRSCFSWCCCISAMFFSSCIKEQFDMDKLAQGQWKPEVAIPLVFSVITVNDLLAQHTLEEISTDANNMVTLIYKGNIYSQTGSNVVTIPNQVVPQFTVTPGLTFPGWGSFTVTDSVVYDFDAGGVDVDSLFVKTGTITVNISSDLQHNGILTVTIPAALKTGAPFTQTLPFTYAGITPVVNSATWSLTDYHISMVGTNNPITILYTVTLTEIPGNPVFPTDQVRLDITAQNIGFSALFGYIGQRDLLSGLEPADVEIFKQAIEGSFYMVDPKVIIRVTNSYGLPIEGTFNKFRAYNKNTNDSLDLQDPVTLGPPAPLAPLVINYPTYSQIGQSVLTNITLDTTNSNSRDIIGISPTNIYYELASGLANPANDPLIRNFLLDTSKFIVDVLIEMPLWGSASAFIVHDTVPFDLGLNDSSGTDVTAEYAVFNVNSTNGFPADVDIQLYFLKDSVTVLDSLLTGPDYRILSSGIVGPPPTLRVIQPTRKMFSVTVDKARLDRLGAATLMIFKSVLSSTNGGSTTVKVYADYTIEVQLSVRVKLVATF